MSNATENEPIGRVENTVVDQTLGKHEGEENKNTEINIPNSPNQCHTEQPPIDEESDTADAGEVVDRDVRMNSPPKDLIEAQKNTDIIITEPKETPVLEDKKALFWRTLTFWQRASLDEDTNISNDLLDMHDEEGVDDSTPPVLNNVIVESIHNNPEQLPLKTQFPIQAATTSISEQVAHTGTNIIQLDVPNNAMADSANDAITFVDDGDDNDHRGSLWNITRRVSYLQFLQPKLEETIETFVPNRLSQIVDTNQQVISDPNTLRTVRSNKSQLDDTGGWWSPWKWDLSKKDSSKLDESASDIGSGVIEDELLKLKRKEVSNQIKLQSYGIPKSVIWGSYCLAGDGFCHVQIMGSYKKPVAMKKLPESAFEVTEKSLPKKKDPEQNNKDFTESIVLPDIRWNYRNLTWRTRCRIALSSIPKLSNVFEPQTHLYMDSSITRKRKASHLVKKTAVIIAFHGFLPQKIVRNTLGEATGSAELMSDVANKELKRWSDINNFDLDVNVINIEGHGKIFERVNGCLSFLDNCMDMIKSCDYLLCVANSHNVPLAIHTISKIVTSGYLDNVEKLGLIGLSGLCLGPVPEIESRISTRGSVGQDNEIISELFDLEDSGSLQGKELIRNMKILIKKNFKVTFIGALNDCFSPLYSSLGLNFTHPNIYRVIYVDKDDHQPDFIVSLFNLILTIRNLNYKDHGLLMKLSSFFTGNIGEGGHSKLLSNKYCYRAGINNMLNTCDLFNEQELVEELTNAKEFIFNNYHIPWCLRGLLEELEKLHKHFDANQIVEQLYQEFKAWEADDAKTKDLRYCMEAFENVMNEDFGF